MKYTVFCPDGEVRYDQDEVTFTKRSEAIDWTEYDHLCKAAGQHRIFSEAQLDKLRELCGKYNVPFSPEDYSTSFDLPDGWVGGWMLQEGKQTLFVGVSPEGEAHS